MHVDVGVGELLAAIKVKPNSMHIPKFMVPKDTISTDDLVKRLVHINKRLRTVVMIYINIWTIKVCPHELVGNLNIITRGDIATVMSSPTVASNLNTLLSNRGDLVVAVDTIGRAAKHTTSTLNKSQISSVVRVINERYN